MKLLIQGAKSVAEVPTLSSLKGKLELVCAEDEAAFARELVDADIMLGWKFRASELKDHWQKAAQLKWVHWCGAGVDAVMFDGLCQSDVVLTNSRGIFDRAMAETLLGYMLMESKDFRTTLDHQKVHKWEHRMSHLLSGDRALIVGVGSIGREFARVLGAMGVKCWGAGRTDRSGDEDFEEIFASSRLPGILNQFQWVIGIMPSTGDTEDFFNREFFNAMSDDARFVNMGRGTAVVEEDLIDALNSGAIAGAMLDVFKNEPLEESDLIWEARNLFVSPHISGDFSGFEEEIMALFTANVDRFLSGKPLHNVVDKSLGFVKN